MRYADRGMPNPFEFSDPVLGQSFADRTAVWQDFTDPQRAGGRSQAWRSDWTRQPLLVPDPPLSWPTRSFAVRWAGCAVM